MATNKLQSPSVSFAKSLTKTPSIPNEYEAFSSVAPNNIKGVELPNEEKIFSQFKKAPLPANTKLYQDLNVTTGVGGYGEGHTVKEIKGGLKERAYRPELLSEMYDTKRTESALVESKLETRKAKEIDSSLFSNTNILNLESTIGEIKIARMKAINDVNDFLSNPKSAVATAFKSNLGEERYKEYSSIISKKESIKSQIKSGDTGLVTNFGGARGVADLPVINTIINNISGGEYEAYTSAIEEARAEGVKGIDEDWHYYAANLAGGALMYGGVSSIAKSGLTSGLSSLGYTVSGRAGAEMVKVANTIQRMSVQSPTLFAATIDNGMSAAIQYGVDKAIGGKHSESDFVNNLFLGAAFPVAFKGAVEGLGKSYKFIKGILPRDLVNLEKAIGNDMKINGSTNVSEAFNNLDESFKFSDNKTLGEKIAEYKSEATKNPDAIVTPEQVISEMAAKGQSISKGGAKRIAKSINSLNEKIKKDGEGSLGNVGVNDRIQMTKQTILGKLSQEGVVDSKKADDILDSAHIENELEYKSTKVSTDDKLDDLFHSKEFSPTKLEEAKDIDSVGKAIEGDNAKPSIKDIETARENIELNANKGPEDVESLATNVGVKFDMDKAIDKVGLVNRDYLHKVLNDIESTVVGFTKYADKIRKGFVSKAKSEANNIKLVAKNSKKGFGTKNVGGEAAKVIKELSDDVKVMMGKLKTAANLKEKTAIKATIIKKNAEIKKIKEELNSKATKAIESKNKKISDITNANAAKNRDRRALIALGKSEIDISGAKPEYKILSTQKIIAIKNEFKARILNKSTIKELEDILVDFNEKIYKSAYKTITKEIDKIISYAKNNTDIDIEFRKKIVQTYSELTDASAGGDLVKMNEALESLKNFVKEGRDVHKENMDIRTMTTQHHGEKILQSLDESGEGVYKARLFNTEIGNEGDLGWGEQFARFAESALQTHTQISRIFEDTYTTVEKMVNGKLQKVKQLVINPANKIFNIDIQRAASKVHLIEAELMDNWLPKLAKGIQEGLGGGNDAHNRALYNFWKVRNRGFGDYTLRDLIFMKKGADGNWEYIPTMKPSTFRKKNAKAIEDGTIVDFHNSPKEVNKAIMDSIYARFDKMYADKNSAFYKADREWRDHSIANGLKLQKLMKDEFNLDWIPDGENYWMINHTNRNDSLEIVNDVAGIEANYRRSINDSFTKEMEGAEGLLATVHDPVRLVGNHVRGNIYYGEMLNPIRRAQSLLNLMRKGKSLIRSRNIDELMKDITSEINGDGEVDPFAIGSVKSKGKGLVLDPLMTPEVDKLIESHINKVSTHGASLGMGVDMGGTRLMDSLYQKLYNQMLSGLLTPAKQAVSLGEGITQAGVKNATSASSSVIDSNNVGLLLDDSGILLQRMPPIYSKEGEGRLLRDTSHESIFNSIGDAINTTINHTTGNIIKTVDGGVALFNFMAGVSKYLDEVHPELHTAGRKLNLTKIKSKLSPEEWNNVLGYSENFMNRIMSSTNKVNDAIGSRHPLMRIALFLGKTGLNSTTLFLENVHKVFQHKYGTSEQASLATSLLLVTAFNQYYLHQLDEGRNKLYVKIGAKTQEDVDKFYDWKGSVIKPEEVTEGDKFAKYLAYFAATRLFAPGRDFDFLSPIAPITNYIGKVDTYPTTGRKIEEAFYAGVSTLIHKDPVDMLRFGASEVAKSAGAESGITKVENTKYDKAVSGIYSSILKDRTDDEGGKVPSFSERLKGITNQGDKIPTGKELDELIPTQISKMDSESSISKEKKIISDNKKELFKDYNSKYGRTPSFNNFAKFVAENNNKFQSAGIDSAAKIMSLYSEMIINENRSKGNEDSLLQGSPARVIFDVKIKPLLDSGNKKDAIEEIIRLRRIKVIKSDSGINDIAKLILSY